MKRYLLVGLFVLAASALATAIVRLDQRYYLRRLEQDRLEQHVEYLEQQNERLYIENELLKAEVESMTTP